MNNDLYKFCESVVEENHDIVRKIVGSEYFDEHADFFYLKFGFNKPSIISDDAREEFLGALEIPQKAIVLYEWCSDALNNIAESKFGIKLF